MFSHLPVRQFPPPPPKKIPHTQSIPLKLITRKNFNPSRLQSPNKIVLPKTHKSSTHPPPLIPQNVISARTKEKPHWPGKVARSTTIPPLEKREPSAETASGRPERDQLKPIEHKQKRTPMPPPPRGWLARLSLSALRVRPGAPLHSRLVGPPPESSSRGRSRPAVGSRRLGPVIGRPGAR